MITVLKQTNPIARKNYFCDACEFLFNLNSPTELGLTFTEYRAVVRAKKNGYKILKGQKYIYQLNADDSGSHWTFRVIPEINEICNKYKLYDKYQ